MSKMDNHGRFWPSWGEGDLCPECGQPVVGCDDVEGHAKLDDEQAANLGGLEMLGFKVSVTAGCLAWHGILEQITDTELVLRDKHRDRHTLLRAKVTAVHGPLREVEARYYR